MSGKQSRVTEAAVREWLRKLGGGREAALRRSKGKDVTPRKAKSDKPASRDT